MNISSAQWKLVLDQGHNIVIAALGAILSASNVNAAVNQTPPKAP